VSVARIVFVAGLSGAGKTQAMKSLEDLGFYCVEHLPPGALDETLHVLDAARVRDVAVTLDFQGSPLLGDVLAAIERASNGRAVSILYVEARNDVLVRRFSETRRRHPFASAGSLREAIARERDALLPLRERATMTIDTTMLTHGALKERIAAAFAPGARSLLAVTLVAFGFKYGLPLDLDLLFDVRFLRNPNYDEVLQPLTGNDGAVAKFIEEDPACSPFVAKVTDMLDFLVPRYVAEGKAQLTIGIGCTGGRHRSVYVAKRLYDHLAADDRLALAVDERDLRR
jgi:RNase adapter protein RapZ